MGSPWWFFLHRKKKTNLKTFVVQISFLAFYDGALRFPDTRHLFKEKRSLPWMAGHGGLCQTHIFICGPWSILRACGPYPCTSPHPLLTEKTTQLVLNSQKIFRLNEGSKDGVRQDAFPMRSKVPFSSLLWLRRRLCLPGRRRQTGHWCDSEGPIRESKFSYPQNNSHAC